MNAKTLVTGTGRCGTSCLMQLLTRLGCNTGFKDAGHGYYNHHSAGQEIIVAPTASGTDRSAYDDIRVIKDPRLCWTLRGILDHDLFPVEHVIIPIREVGTASQSRMAKSLTMLGNGDKPDVRKPAQQQTRFMYESLGHLFETLAMNEIPYTTIQYPRMITDWRYAYRRLRQTPLLDSVTESDFESAHGDVMDVGRITVEEGRALPYIQRQRDGVPFAEADHINRQVFGWRGDPPSNGTDK